MLAESLHKLAGSLYNYCIAHSRRLASVTIRGDDSADGERRLRHVLGRIGYSINQDLTIMSVRSGGNSSKSEA